LEIDHVGQEQHKMKEQKAKQSLFGFHQDLFWGGGGEWGAQFQILGLNKPERNIFVTISCQISPNFEEFSTDLETSS
jgi:hypothetical protein